MVFKPGQSGNPAGQNGRKVFVDALHAIISQEPTEDLKVPALPRKSTVAHLMAQKLVEGALRDDWKPGEALEYLREVCDRAYGKVKSVDDAPTSSRKDTVIIVLDQLRRTVETVARTGLEPLLIETSLESISET